ncbi:MAG TPA: 16S rRNA (guanine(527)-N(7))-methyltransferase RsmG [Blastocatellia bacterium]|nr:16S rRNA (guanine(527)-N(7))-methyltransferase RsmG [Blastocatellia bacterium]
MMPADVDQLKNILRNSGKQTSGSVAGKRFSEAEIDLLSKYFEIVLKWNARLHLTTLTQPQDFFDRHILESSFSESLFLPSVNQVWDIGSGLGVPGIVVAILRPDLAVHLVEAGRNRSLFLEEAAAHLRLSNVKVIESRFESIKSIPAESCLTARAIEGMEKLLPEIINSGSEAAQILIFGAKNLEEKARGLLDDQRQIESFLIPGSNRRYIINIFRST